MIYEIKHRYTRAVIFSRDCNLLRECVEAAVQEGADLTLADLAGADLHGAYLAGADLHGAYLAHADLTRVDLIDSGQDHRGYRFWAWCDGETVVYRAGCHEWRDAAEWREHYGPSYDNDGDPAECMARLEFLHKEATRRWS